MDEPESKGAITIAVREKIRQPVLVINCNYSVLMAQLQVTAKLLTN